MRRLALALVATFLALIAMSCASTPPPLFKCPMGCYAVETGGVCPECGMTMMVDEAERERRKREKREKETRKTTDRPQGGGAHH